MFHLEKYQKIIYYLNLSFSIFVLSLSSCWIRLLILLTTEKQKNGWNELYSKRVLKNIKNKNAIQSQFSLHEMFSITRRNSNAEWENVEIKQKNVQSHVLFGDLINNPKLFHISQIIIAKRHLNYSQNVKWIHFSHKKKKTEEEKQKPLWVKHLYATTFYTFIQ